MAGYRELSPAGTLCGRIGLYAITGGTDVLDPRHWPDWFQAARLFITFALTAGFGIHAYNAHKQEVVEAVSPRKWMYWLYAMVFLVAGIANFMQLVITLVFQSYEKASFHLGYSTLLLILSYVALLVGVRVTSRGLRGG